MTDIPMRLAFVPSPTMGDEFVSNFAFPSLNLLGLLLPSDFVIEAAVSAAMVITIVAGASNIAVDVGPFCNHDPVPSRQNQSNCVPLFVKKEEKDQRLVEQITGRQRNTITLLL